MGGRGHRYPGRAHIGEALYKAGATGEPAAWQDPAELSRHLAFDADHPQVRGNVFFSASDVVADPIGAMGRVVADHYGTAARRPGRSADDTADRPGRGR